MKKTTITILFLTTILMLVGVIGIKTTILADDNEGYINTPFDLSDFESEYNFSQFLDDNKTSSFPNFSYSVDIESFTFENSDYGEEEPYIKMFSDDYEKTKKGVYIPETGEITFNVNVEAEGLYNIKIEYYTVEGRSASIHKGIKINNDYQYLELERININRFWEDEFKVSERRDEKFDDLRPKQQEVHLWESKVLADEMGYYNIPYYFKFKQGLNKITFTSQREPVVISSIVLLQEESNKTYEEYLNYYESRNVSIINNDFNYTIQAEEAYLKSSPTLSPTAEFSTFKYVPYKKYTTRYNAIGGQNWRIPGDEITWLIEVPEEGLYNINFKIMQNFSRGKNSTRVFKVNGEVPFLEAGELEFKYSSDLQNVSLGGKENYLIYLKKGENTISLTSTIGVYGDVVNQVNLEVKKLRTLYRQIVMRTGLALDALQDYMLFKNISLLEDRLKESLHNLKVARNEIINISKGRSELVSSYDRTIYQIEKFLKDEKNIQKGLKEFEQNISSLASWVLSVSEQPLIIDEITVHGSSYKVPKASINFFQRFWHEIVLFFGSFRDIGDFGSNQKVDGPTIEVWTGTGRDQTTVLRQLIDESFVNQYNINVKLKMVNMGILLSATLSGNGPDVAIGVDHKLPVNWGIRGAIKELSEFSDFEEVAPWFSRSSMEPLTFQGKTYALPNTEDFLIMFYREDILKELGINNVPETWEEVIDISPVLQKQYLDFYIPVVQGALNETFYSMIKQKGNNLYSEDGTKVDLLNKENVETFIKYTRFFTDYGFVLEADFLNRFRSGQMPIGLSYFSLYNSLSVFAPEIQGQWSYALIPGTKDSEGNINHATSSSVGSTVILNDSKYTNESWEFLKWFHSEEVQLDYARGLEAILGAAARYPTANTNAFAQLSWSAKDYAILEKQRNEAYGLPTIPGDYIVGRHIDNAFRLTLNEKVIPQDSIYQYSLIINEELARKRKELGLD